MKYLFIAVLFTVSGCGYESLHNEMVGQVKRISFNTPVICPNYTSADISLGVLRGGVGSMSTEDVWVVVPNEADLKALKLANDLGAIVKITYDVKRISFCRQDHLVTSAILETE